MDISLTRRDIAMPPPTVLAACEVGTETARDAASGGFAPCGRAPPSIFEDRWIDLKTGPGNKRRSIWPGKAPTEWLVLNRPSPVADVRLYAIQRLGRSGPPCSTVAPTSGSLVIERSTLDYRCRHHDGQGHRSPGLSAFWRQA